MLQNMNNYEAERVQNVAFARNMASLRHNGISYDGQKHLIWRGAE